MTQPVEVFTNQGWGKAFSQGANLAVASGTIDALGAVTLAHQTSNILSITANIGAGTITVNFENNFDTDGIFFAVAFVYDPGVGTSPFLPITQTSSQCVFSGVFPGAAPWKFAIFAVANS
jgi:hypothetical protein